jgi:hypothetical protein
MWAEEGGMVKVGEAVVVLKKGVEAVVVVNSGRGGVVTAAVVSAERGEASAVGARKVSGMLLTKAGASKRSRTRTLARSTSLGMIWAEVLEVVMEMAGVVEMGVAAVVLGEGVEVVVAVGIKVSGGSAGGGRVRSAWESAGMVEASAV